MAQSKGSLKSFGVKRREKILGTTGLASGWSERTSTTGPSEPLASLNPAPEQDCCLGLNCEKRPFTDQPDERGVRQTSTTLVSCESANYKLSKTIQGTMLHKTAHLRAWQESRPCADLTL